MSKKVLSVAFVLMLLLGSPSLSVAAKSTPDVGDTKTVSKTITLKQVNNVINNMDEAIDKKSGSTLVNYMGELFGFSPIGLAYEGSINAVKGKIKKDRNAYKKVQTEMINNDYSKVTIKYHLKYTKWKVGNDPIHEWKVTSKEAAGFK